MYVLIEILHQTRPEMNVFKRKRPELLVGGGLRGWEGGRTSEGKGGARSVMDRDLRGIGSFLNGIGFSAINQTTPTQN